MAKEFIWPLGYLANDPVYRGEVTTLNSFYTLENIFIAVASGTAVRQFVLGF
jgi:hypothetical protein